VVGGVVAVVLFGVLQFEPGEHLAESSLYERLELDEAPFLLLVTVAGLGIFATRRWLETTRAARRADEVVVALREQDARRVVDNERQRFERRLHGALDMAQTEVAALDVGERAMVEAAPGAPIELLLADSSNSHLGQAMTTDREDCGPGCPVPTPNQCPAIRRGRTLTFPSSEDFDGCTFLRGRPYGPVSATCAPVSIMGQTVGVLHTTAPHGSPPPEPVAVAMEQLAVRMGDRLGVIRAFQRSETQAATDPLTGLLNRRTLEEQVAAMLRAGRNVTVAFGDLDHFKDLNDTYGHESGDRALRLFSKTLRDCARKEDLVSRWGGEEFLVVLPDTSATQGCAFAERVREELALRLTQATTPPFTASFGFSDTTDGDRFEDLLLLADNALLAAKRAGRNRAVLASTLHDDGRVAEEAAP